MPGALVPTNRSFESVRRAKRQKMNGLFQSVSRNPGPVTIKKRNAFSPSLLFIVHSALGNKLFGLFLHNREDNNMVCIGAVAVLRRLIRGLGVSSRPGWKAAADGNFLTFGVSKYWAGFLLVSLRKISPLWSYSPTLHVLVMWWASLY